MTDDPPRMYHQECQLCEAGTPHTPFEHLEDLIASGRRPRNSEARLLSVAWTTAPEEPA